MGINIKYSSYVLWVLIIAITLITCRNTDQPIIPTYDPEIIVDISGDINLKYEAQGWVTISSDEKAIFFGSSAEIQKKKYGFALAIFFKDTIQIGTYVFANAKNKPDTTYAVAAFEYGSGSDKKTFISQTGEIVITDLTGTKLFGSFNFIATNDDSTLHITANNGILQALH